MLRSFLIQAIIVVIFFNFVSWLRETEMLETSGKLSVSEHLLPTLDEKTIEIASQGKSTVIYFFAPWCQVCHASISNLQALYEKNENIDVIAIALDYLDVNEVKRFTQQHKLTFDIALGNEEIKKAYKIQGYPSYYVIDHQNKVTAKSMGYSTELGLFLRSL